MTKTNANRTLDDMIRAAGWYKGTEADWRKLSSEEMHRIAFAGCGCAIAWPTWEGPVDCVHSMCQVLRGEIKPIVVLNRQMRGEAESGWLRGNSRAHLAKLFRAYRAAARERGVYDIWKLDWRTVVLSGVQAL